MSRVVCEKKAAIAAIRLNRPGKLNAITREILDNATAPRQTAFAVYDGRKIGPTL